VTTKFNPKKYRDKARLCIAVPGAPHISKLWVWNASRQEYVAPERGHRYVARRWEQCLDGKRTRKLAHFGTLEEARNWISGAFVPSSAQPPSIQAELPVLKAEKPVGPTLLEIVEHWKRHRWESLAQGTRVNYSRYLRLHIHPLLDFPIASISPQVVD
jgi:hypothetical protein